MRSPRIGITPEGSTADGQFILPQEYLRAVQRAGGIPIMIPPWEEMVDTLLDMVDGLLLAGGGDIAPERYGSGGHAEVYGIDTVRDAGEFALFYAARDRGMPILGICRGAQLANVALGGTLIEHLPERTAQSHRAVPSGGVCHTVQTVLGTRLFGTLADGSVAERDSKRTTQVISWHHQAIDRAADGLVVSAHAEDGTIEAIEAVNGAWMVAVQWHPELSAGEDPVQQRLFDAFVQACTVD